MARFSQSLKSSLPLQTTSWRNTLGLSKRGQNGFVAGSLPPTPPGLSPLPLLPTLPTVSDFPLKDSSETKAQGSRRQRPGLFMELVRDPAVLYQEYLEDPEEFDPEVAQLLTDLVTRKRTLDALTAEEMRQLDQATVVMAQSSPKPSKDKSQSSESKTRSPIDLDDDFGEEDEEIEWNGGDMSLSPLPDPIPMPTVPTMWWDKGPGGALR